MSILSPEALKHAKKVIETGQDIEKTWLNDPGRTSFGIADFKDLISGCEKFHEVEINRLAKYARDLQPTTSLRHLLTILVPFERLVNLALRDDEFLIETHDREVDPTRKRPFICICDSLRSSFNVGSILRTADAFGISDVVMTGYTATPDNDKTARTSLGAEKTVNWKSTSHPIDAINDARNQGFTIIALETSPKAKDLAEYMWPEKPALLLGNERFGLSSDLLAHADHVLKIPMYGAKNSLNVGIAFGIVAAHWRQQVEKKASPLEALAVNPIGIFSGPAIHPYEAPRQGIAQLDTTEGVITLNGGQDFEQGLKDVGGFERLWIIYKFDRNKNWKPLTTPPRGENVKRGVFATRSPYRPNPIGLSCVKLNRIEGRKLFISEFDLLDQTPILDIKPYLPYADAFPYAKAGWTDTLDESKMAVAYSALALKQIEWLNRNAVGNIGEFLHQQLSFCPTDKSRKRVEEVPDGFVLAYRTWRIYFRIEAKDVFVDELRSGYSTEELATKDDLYKDKHFHRDFLKIFS
jgi:tRNA-Thr(GGU) m(6)t(6)A37 methyltransferase TsaA